MSSNQKICLFLLSCLVGFLPNRLVCADDRTAIVDIAIDSRPYLQKLRNSGVEVIGRYYGRCAQWAGKRLIDTVELDENESEVNKILENFAILSIYQFYSGSKNKLYGLQNPGESLPDAACNKQERPHSIEVEARLDADAAVLQAKSVGQPNGTAIYIGIDFEVEENDRETHSRLLSYFGIVSSILRANEFKVGAYGSGLTLTLLKDLSLDNGKPAVDYFWLSPSRSYPGTIKFFNDGGWHLSQNAVDLQWYSVVREGHCRGLTLDTNIQNVNFANEYIGFWKKRDLYSISAQRTTDVFHSRRFSCDGSLIIRKGPKSDSEVVDMRSCVRAYIPCEPTIPGRLAPQACHGTAMRVIQQAGNFSQIDYNDDGFPDGYVETARLTPSFAKRPEYIHQEAVRRSTSCR